MILACSLPSSPSNISPPGGLGRATAGGTRPRGRVRDHLHALVVARHHLLHRGDGVRGGQPLSSHEAMVVAFATERMRAGQRKGVETKNRQVTGSSGVGF